MNTNTCIVTRGYRHSWKYCFWCPFGEIKLISHWKKKQTNKQTKKNKYPLSVITVFQYFKYINNKLKDRNIVVRGKVTISTVEQNDTPVNYPDPDPVRVSKRMTEIVTK